MEDIRKAEDIKKITGWEIMMAQAQIIVVDTIRVGEDIKKTMGKIRGDIRKVTQIISRVTRVPQIVFNKIAD